MTIYFSLHDVLDWCGIAYALGVLTIPIIFFLWGLIKVGRNKK